VGQGEYKIRPYKEFLSPERLPAWGQAGAWPENWVPKLELRNQPFMSLRLTQNHEKA
jgi:hypothetical protein